MDNAPRLFSLHQSKHRWWSPRKNPQEKKFNYAELEAILILPKMMSSVAKSQAWNAF